MITIVLPISRTDYLRPVFHCLAALDKPEDTELLIITDGNEALEQAVNKRLDLLNYNRIQVISFGEAPAEHINDRRYRISAIHNKIAHYLPKDCNLVFSIEDDTTYPPNTLTKMCKIFNDNYDCAFVEGVELGRWNAPYVGAWKFDNLEDPSEILSVLPSEGVQEIDAGGLYCALIDAEIYRQHWFEPYDLGGENGLSCDLNLGHSIRMQGGRCFIDWSIDCDHIGIRGSVNRGNTVPIQVGFYKDHGGNWRGKYVCS